MLFDFATRRWTKLAQAVTGDNVSWSRDGKYVYADSPFGDDHVLLRVRIRDRKVERIASLKDLELLPGALGAWFGLDPTDAPILFHDATVPEVFAFDWEAP